MTILSSQGHPRHNKSSEENANDNDEEPENDKVVINIVDIHKIDEVINADIERKVDIIKKDINIKHIKTPQSSPPGERFGPSEKTIRAEEEDKKVNNTKAIDMF